MGNGPEARARRLLHDLDVDLGEPLDVDELCLKFSLLRGRPIQLVEFYFPDPRIFGAWIDCDDQDVIFHDVNLVPRQRTRTILHEIGHMALEHEPDDGDGAVARMLAPHLPPGMVWRRCFRRDCFESPQENDAEHFAAMLQYWSNRAIAARQRSISGGRLEDAVDLF